MKKERPLLTIGMATYDDYDGVYFSVQSLKLHHDLEDVELIVIDNNPKGTHAGGVKGLIHNSQGSGFHSARYIPFEESTGTTQTRQKVFDEASGKFVLCMDCHVLFDTDAIKKLKEYYTNNPDDSNLNSGPLIYDNNINHSTHFDLFWRGGMFGVWATAWTDDKGNNFCTRQGPNNTCTFWTLDSDAVEIKEFNGTPVPTLPYAGHQDQLKVLGFREMGASADEDPFQIPAMGLGVFSCRKDAWLGFNPHMREFGGEEGYIHIKYEQAGRKNMCLPFLRWNHRFHRIGGPKYTATDYGKIRNYVLGFKEIGRPMDGIYEHFIKQGKMSLPKFNELLNDPTPYKPPRSLSKEEVQGNALTYPMEGLNIEQLFNWVSGQHRDLNEHMDTLKQLADQCDHITEFTKRRESTVAFLASDVKKVVSYQEEIYDKLIVKYLPESNFKPKWSLSRGGNSLTHDIEETDLLFLDTKHNAEQIVKELNKHAAKVKKFIVIHDTEIHGLTGDNGKEGLGFGLKEWLTENPNWFVSGHDMKQYGLTVLSHDPEYIPTRPIWAYPPEWGAGTYLKKDLEWFNIKETEGCACGDNALRMDKFGADWCKTNIDLVMKWLETEYEKRKEAGEIKFLPFVKPAVKLLVNKAIKKAKKKELEFIKDLKNAQKSNLVDDDTAKI